MQAIKLMTFDATNTLLKFKIPPWEYYSIVGQQYGYIGDVKILKEQMRNSFKIMNAKHPNFGKSDIGWETWWKKIVMLTFENQLPISADIGIISNKLIYEFCTSRCWTLAEGSQKLLKILKLNGVSIGVISNFDPRLVPILQDINLYEKFDFVITSYDVGYSKPDKKIFHHAINTSNRIVKPSECLHIGDDYEKDYNGARNAGWHALLVNSSTTTNVSTPSPQHVFSSVAELCLALEQNRIQL